MARYKDDGNLFEVDGPILPKTQSACPSHLKTRNRKTIRAIVECWQQSSKFTSLKEIALGVRSQVLSIKDHRNGEGKSVFKHTPGGNGQVFAITALDLQILGVADIVLQHVISDPWLHRFFAASREDAPSPRFPFRCSLQIALSLVRCLTMQDAAPCYR